MGSPHPVVGVPPAGQPYAFALPVGADSLGRAGRVDVREKVAGERMKGMEGAVSFGVPPFRVWVVFLNPSR